MKTEYIEELSLNNISLKKELNLLKKYRNNLKMQLELVKRARAYILWQKINYIKNKLSIKNILKSIKRKYLNFKYDLNDFDTFDHDFIILKKRDKLWKFLDFEKVGEDWHAVILRTSDSKEFLLDQPSFYALQIIDNSKINLFQELFITYAINKEDLHLIKSVLKRLKLC